MTPPCSFLPTPASTNIGGVQYFTNGLDTRTQGIDLTGNLRVPAGASGTLDLNASVNYTKNKIIRVDPLPQVLVDAGSTEPGLLDIVTTIGIQDERPDWRGTLQANYSVARFSALGRLLVLRRVLLGPAGLLRPLPRELRRQGPVRH